VLSSWSILVTTLKRGFMAAERKLADEAKRTGMEFVYSPNQIIFQILHMTCK
jgi:hypothetical protein